MLELMLCSMFTILPDYLFRRYRQASRLMASPRKNLALPLMSSTHRFVGRDDAAGGAAAVCRLILLAHDTFLRKSPRLATPDALAPG